MSYASNGRTALTGEDIDRLERRIRAGNASRVDEALYDRIVANRVLAGGPLGPQNNVDIYLGMQDVVRRGIGGSNPDDQRRRRSQLSDLGVRLRGERDRLLALVGADGGFRGTDNDALRLARLQEADLPDVVLVDGDNERQPVYIHLGNNGERHRPQAPPRARPEGPPRQGGGDTQRGQQPQLDALAVLQRLRATRGQGYPISADNVTYDDENRLFLAGQQRPKRHNLLQLTQGAARAGDAPPRDSTPLCLGAGGIRVRYGPMQLQEHQIKAVCMLLKDSVRGLLLYYGMGSGKTLASIACIDHLARQAAAREGRFRRILVFVPAPLQDNYRAAVRLAEIEGTDPVPQIVSHGALTRLRKHQMYDLARDAMVVIDEAHTLRNELADHRRAPAPASGAEYPSTAKHLALAARVARKVLLLTGTPVVNWPRDIAPLVNAVKHNSLRATPEEFDAVFGQRGDANRDVLEEALRCSVLYHATGSANMPRVEVHDVETPMGPRQQSAHRSACEANRGRDVVETSAFMAKHRQACNAAFYHRRSDGHEEPVPMRQEGVVPANGAVEAECTKIEDVVAHTIDAHYQRPLRADGSAGQLLKTMVYSFFDTYGVRVVQRLLEEHGGLVEGRDFVVLTGETSNARKTEMIDMYNRDEVRVLLMTSTASQGISLRGTDHVHIVEPDFNVSIIEQVMARAVRMGSHEGRDRRVVHVHRHYSTLPGHWDANGSLREVGADMYLRGLCARKQDARDAFLAFVQGVARRNERLC